MTLSMHGLILGRQAAGSLVLAGTRRGGPVSAYCAPVSPSQRTVPAMWRITEAIAGGAWLRWKRYPGNGLVTDKKLLLKSLGHQLSRIPDSLGKWLGSTPYWDLGRTWLSRGTSDAGGVCWSIFSTTTRDNGFVRGFRHLPTIEAPEGLFVAILTDLLNEAPPIRHYSVVPGV
ncbi:hypothetical protein BO94DRAFT_385015 [Aspergillus sclerotioniger CBS 115572]|uniref:Uncharacterized protein n=1 Tax=Aspergillus sclerotioniger CBS 115572 TaxID=1450535 RepID=A0A317X376_9EURO|nr:hypothetical protein BO94DRAFT_385015 [Aspergillus sclerotioniger CBS 115572]PWY91957.1 hypothetical protein BO94DRAFT_385015 [Aspergillus sclerotioniger CBS 115572]